MNLKFTLEDNTNIIYNSSTNQLLKDNIPFEINDEIEYKCNYDLHVRLFLGNKCNYNCKYCLQDFIKKDKELDVNIDKFCNDLLRFLQNRKIEISFWGGETFLYLDYIKELTNRLNNKIDKLYITTNGSTLGDLNTFNWIKDNINKIGRITVSYDGPGQSLRGPDILDNIDIKNNINYLISQNKFAFNGIITKENNSFENYINYIKDKLNLNDLNNLLLEMGILSVTSNSSLNCSLNEEEYLNFIVNYYNYIYDNNLFDNVYTLSSSIKSMLTNFNNINQVSPCSTNDPYCLSVKLNGDIVICHNGLSGTYTTLDKLKPGTLAPKPTKKIITTENWNTICKTCIVKYFCNGGCANEPKKYQKYNCLGHRYKYLFILLCLISKITNSKIKSIEFV